MVERKVNYLIFKSSQALQNYLKRKLNPLKEGRIEYCVMEKYPVNRILFTAEHAQAGEIPMSQFGPKAHIHIGDANTDLLAKLAAYSIKSAYMISWMIRTEADASRDPANLDKGLLLFARIFNSNGPKTAYVPIHNNPALLTELNRYHQMIEKKNPNVLISIHGMNVKRKFDLLFGFGDDYAAIGGKKEAFRFKNEFIEYLSRVFGQLGIRKRLIIGVSTWLLAGHRNFVLNKHVIDYNKENKRQRIGMQLEFNWRGRVVSSDMFRPTIPYQIMVQALGDFIYRWSFNLR